MILLRAGPRGWPEGLLFHWFEETECWPFFSLPADAQVVWFTITAMSLVAVLPESSYSTTLTVSCAPTPLGKGWSHVPASKPSQGRSQCSTPGILWLMTVPRG